MNFLQFYVIYFDKITFYLRAPSIFIFIMGVMALALPLLLLRGQAPSPGTSLTLVPNLPLGPINREMRHLISSLQNHNHRLKGDAQRYKRKLREVQAEIGKVRRGLYRSSLG